MPVRFDVHSSRWMTTRYLLALAIIALSAVVAHFLGENLIARHQGTLEVVNISGRQRMLSQRSALLVERLRTADADSRPELLGKLKLAVATFESAHRRLTGAGPEPALGSEIRDLYFNGPVPLNSQVLQYITALNQVIGAVDRGQPVPAEAAGAIAGQALGPLLERLDDMVAKYQENGEHGFHIVREIGFAALLATLCTLVLEALLIFRPMVRRVERQIGEIGEMTTQLEQVNAGLEDEVRQRTAQFEAARDAAELANRAKSRFLAHAGHDLKQPLEAIGMFTGLLERHVDHPRALPILKDMRLAQASMRSLLNSILDLSKLESGVIEAQMATVPLGPLLDRLAREFLPQAADADLRFSTPATTAVVWSDPALLERVVRNFLSNALRYATHGGVVVGCRHRGGLVWVEVHDTGPGIPEADRARIFEEFIQLDRPDRDRSQGIGLGLAIVDRLARLMEHPLAVRPRKGGGTVFAIGMRRLPPAAATP